MIPTLESRGFTGFGAGIEVEHLVTPADWQRHGIGRRGAVLREPQDFPDGAVPAADTDRHIENLVFCGANTQPGVGVPMVMISGRLAAERITGDHARPRPTHIAVGAAR